jgi:hypothetical protein
MLLPKRTHVVGGFARGGRVAARQARQLVLLALLIQCCFTDVFLGHGEVKSWMCVKCAQIDTERKLVR